MKKLVNGYRLEPRYIGYDTDVVERHYTVVAHQIQEKWFVFTSPETIVHVDMDKSVDLGAIAWDEEVVVLPRNPCYIAGIDMLSTDGQELALQYTAAIAAHGQQYGWASMLIDRCDSHIDALIYRGWGTGDGVAKDEFLGYAITGEAFIQQQRGDIVARIWDPEYQEFRTSCLKGTGYDKITLDDVFVVHETSYPIVRNENGDVILRPVEDHDPRWRRGTIHFTLNHVVEGHMWRTGEGAQRAIIARLSDVINANPGALEVLYAIDTYFTPEIGKALVLPNASVVEYGEGIDRTRATWDVMNNLGCTRYFAPGMHYSSDQANFWCYLWAHKLGVMSGLHGNMGHSFAERLTTSVPMSWVAEMGRNARIRLVSHNLRTSGNVTLVEDEMCATTL
jgi:hypothetical protein